MDLELLTECEYRGTKIAFYNDDYGQQVIAVFTFPDGREDTVSMGAFNTEYKADAEWLVDEHLDFISDFKAFPGVVLKWFDNGTLGARDIGLFYRTRLLHVFIVVDESLIKEDTLDNIKQESLNRLNKLSAILN